MEDTRTTPLNQLIWTHRDWSTKDTAYMGLAQVLCMCIIAFSLVLLWDSWVCQQVGLSFMYLVLELFYFCWFAFPNFDVMVFVYLIMFYLVMFGSYLENNLKKSTHTNDKKFIYSPKPLLKALILSLIYLSSL